MRIDLCGPGYIGMSPMLDPSRRINLFVERGAKESKAPFALIGSPGTSLQYSLGSSIARAIYPFNGLLFAVVGSQLYTVSVTGNLTAVPGAVLGTSVGPVIMKDNGLQVSGTGGNMLAICDQNSLYIYNTSGSFASAGSFTGGGFPVAGAYALEYIDGYFIISAPGSMAVYACDPFNGINWQPTAVAYIQSAPDTVLAIWNLDEQLYFIKQYTTEIWYNNSTPTSVGFPFSRMTAAVIDYGTVSQTAVARGGGVLFMLANRRNGDRGNFIGAVKIQNGTPSIISPPAITLQMEKWKPWSDVISFCYEENGHTFWEVTSPSYNQTFVYDDSIGGDPFLSWHERSSYIPNSPYQTNRHIANCYAYFNNMHLVGDYTNGNIYQMSGSIYTDNGNPLVAIRTAQMLDDKKGMMSSLNLHKLVVDAQTGYGGSIAFDWSDDGGYNWSGEYSRSLGPVGQYQTRLSWYPLGQHPYGFIPRLKISDPVPRIIMGAYVD